MDSSESSEQWSRPIQAVGAVAFIVLWRSALELAPAGGLFEMVFVAAVAFGGLIGGTRLPYLIRLVSTLALFVYGADMFLLGRTMEPRLTETTFQMAVFFWVLWAGLPTLSVLRMWKRRTALLLLALLPLGGFLLACAVAEVEERHFMAKYRSSGVGPTPRWTVSHHWLSYNKDTGRLDGSD